MDTADLSRNTLNTLHLVLEVSRIYRFEITIICLQFIQLACHICHKLLYFYDTSALVVRRFLRILNVRSDTNLPFSPPSRPSSAVLYRFYTKLIICRYFQQSVRNRTNRSLIRDFLRNPICLADFEERFVPPLITGCNFSS